VNERSRGALGYQFDSTGVDNWFAKSPFNSSLLPAVGDVVTFDTLSVPYAFALTAAYDTGMIDSSSDINELHAPQGLFFALIVHSELKSVHPGFPVAFIFYAQVRPN